MNERIKELLTPKLKEWGGASSDNFSEELEKFAELIVKECASKVDNILREKRDGGGTMGDEIRDHFGVNHDS